MVRKEFEVHLLNETGIARAQQMAVDFNLFLHQLESLVGTAEGREMAIVRTKLEEACFFAKKALANQPQHQR
jgi:hypothetical protein